ncbi:PIR protein CIR protein [Plasmodium vinckei brucechwatti]|uniref:PIR protein CIR protein n=1 Tax=Plasmodium vinckei brucechwatti TaxID=119398 RepID=A0A6V7RT36_PLAVN|nr:PIR protein CIR protein [Plasmodium vinckei brucechwatti]
MANSKNAYYEIYMINDYFSEGQNGSAIVKKKYKSIHDYCYNGNNSGFGNYRNYIEMVSCSVIYLLRSLKNMYNLEDDKLAEYAILWLSYKLNKKQKNGGMNLNDFYTNYIVKNNHYNEKIKSNDSLTYKEIINTKKDLMDMDIKEIFKFNNPFHILFYLNYVYHDEYLDCTNNSNLAKSFAKQFGELSKDSKNIEESLYNKMLSTLSDDYNKLKSIFGKKSCNFPSLPKIEPKKIPVVNPEKSSGQPTALSSDVISSSSSISTKLIPALSTFSVIPVFLGIAYKYSLFGIDKIFQRQYLRKKLKKVKRKMKLNI